MPKQPKAKLWIKVDLGEGRQIGPGKIALLKAIERERSIAGAARALEMSYRRAWLLVDEMNRDLAAPVVETRIGGRQRGGAVLTELGADLIELFEGLRSKVEAQSAGPLERIARLAGDGTEKA